MMRKLTGAAGLLIILIMFQSVGCKKDSDYRTKYYGDYQFSIHKVAQVGATQYDTTYIVSGTINEGNSSHTIFIIWGAVNGDNRSLVELSEDGTFSDITCTGEFRDVNTVRFTAYRFHTNSCITYNVTGTRK